MKYFALAALLALFIACHAEEIKIGGDDGWTRMEYDDIEAAVGDVVLFEWEGEHNVGITDDATCDDLDDVDETNDASPWSYEITEDDAGETLTFVSTVEGDCEEGMIISVTVAGNDNDDNDDNGEPDDENDNNDEPDDEDENDNDNNDEPDDEDGDDNNDEPDDEDDNDEPDDEDDDGEPDDEDDDGEPDDEDDDGEPDDEDDDGEPDDEDDDDEDDDDEDDGK